MSSPIERLRTLVIDPIKQRFVGRDEVVDLIALAVVSGEHLFLFGPPGTAKSALIRAFASTVRGRYFEYLLTRFSEPNEVFGPIDLTKLREGQVATVITGMLPEAEFAFLDELFNANSAILNNLLTVLNERIYRRGAELHRLPLISLFAASNNLPEDEALQALFDRFLLRCRLQALPRKSLPGLLVSGWNLENAQDAAAVTEAPTAEELRALAGECRNVDLRGIMEPYADAVCKIRDLGVALTDRRCVKILKLIAGSAVLCSRTVANTSDFWVLRYIWDREEQIAPLSSLVAGLLQSAPETAKHTLAGVPEKTDPAELAKQLEAIENSLKEPKNSLIELARLRERLSDIADRTEWVADSAARGHLTLRAHKIREKLG